MQQKPISRFGILAGSALNKRPNISASEWSAAIRDDKDSMKHCTVSVISGELCYEYLYTALWRIRCRSAVCYGKAAMLLARGSPSRALSTD